MLGESFSEGFSEDSGQEVSGLLDSAMNTPLWAMFGEFDELHQVRNRNHPATSSNEPFASLTSSTRFEAAAARGGARGAPSTLAPRLRDT